MKVLLVTGKLASNIVKEIASTLKIKADVLVLNYPIASLMTVDYIAENLKGKKLDDYDYIILPGLVAGDARKIEEIAKIRTIKGTEDIQDLPIMIELLEKGIEFSTLYPADKVIKREKFRDIKNILAKIEENGEYKFEVDGIKIPIRPPPFRIFLELDGSKSLEELMEEVLEKKKYIDVAVIGFPNGHFDVDEVRKKVSKLRDILPVGIDSASTEELIEGVKAGASFVFNLNEENLEKLESIKNLSAFVIAPLSVENKADLTLKIYERAKKIGFEKLILDPILSPPLLGVVDSIIDYKKVRESVSEPMLMGILNVTELIDADSVGINALLTSIAGELGIGNLLTMENGKTVGSVFEVKKATQMVSISLTQKKLPKNIGVDLLILKDKKKYQENPIDIINPEVVKGHEEPKMMDNGFVKITKDDKWIYLTWYGKERFTIIGDDGLTIGRKLVQRTNINPEHAIYIGYELAKAEIALKLNKNYVQDKPLFKYDKGDDSINNSEGDD